MGRPLSYQHQVKCDLLGKLNPGQGDAFTPHISVAPMSVEEARAFSPWARWQVGLHSKSIQPASHPSFYTPTGDGGSLGGTKLQVTVGFSFDVTLLVPCLRCVGQA